MLIFNTAAILLSTLYALLLLAFRRAWLRTEDTSAGLGNVTEQVSIIVAARNESAHLPALLSSLLEQDYPADRLEIIVVDDASEDNSLDILRAAAPRITALSLPRDAALAAGGFVAYKKRALAAGIELSHGSLIVTTDADCTMGPGWISALVDFRAQRSAEFVAAPVQLTPARGLLQAFQRTDFMTMQGITAAVLKLRAGSMANGANLLFTRGAYLAAGGYTGSLHLASGDDLLLMAQVARLFPRSVHYCKSYRAVVSTAAQPTWRSFFNQRIRWASKSGKYNDPKLTAILALVYLLNVALGVAFMLLLFRMIDWPLPVGCLLLKVMAELLLAVPVFRFFGERRLVQALLLLQPLHILYIIASGFLGMIGRYEWKGRMVR